MKIAVLLFNQNHFSQTLSLLKNRRLSQDEIVSIPLDAYSLREVKKYGYRFIYPDYKLKEKIRADLLRDIPTKIQEWATVEVAHGQMLREYLALKDIDIWDIVKNEMAIGLFEKLYFIELIRHIVLDIAPDKVIIPPLPLTIPLYYMITIKRKTVVKSIESLGITVENARWSLFTLLQYGITSALDFIKNLTFVFEIALPRQIYSEISNKKKSIFKRASQENKKRGGILGLGCLSASNPRQITCVLTALRQKDYNCSVMVNNEHDIEILNWALQESITLVSTKDYKNKITKFHERSNRYNEKWRALKKVKRNEKFFNYGGISLWDNEYDDVAFFLTPRLAMNIFKNYELFEKVLQSEKPRLLIFPDDQKIIGRICAKVAEREKIACLCVPNAGDQLSESIPVLDSLKHGKYAVSGEMVCETKGGWNGDKTNVVVTGYPPWDNHCKASPVYAKDELCKILHIKSNSDGIFLFTMQGGLPENKEVLRIIVAAMGHFPNKHLVIRPHPTEPEKEYVRYLRRLGMNNVTISKKFDFYTIALISELVFTCYSLTGFEAILLDKPVVGINVSCYPDVMPYVRYGAALGAYQEEDLIPAIEKVLYDYPTRERLKAGRQKIIEDYAYKLNGKATERIIEAISHLVNKN